MLEKMDPHFSQLLDYLWENDVISPEDKEYVQSEQDSYIRRQRMLYVIMMKSAEESKRFNEAFDMICGTNLAGTFNGILESLI